MAIFDIWCDKPVELHARTKLWTVTEKAGGRMSIQPDLIRTVRSHYDELALISNDIADLGYAGAEEILKARLPQTAKARSGDLGEIVATEFAREVFGFVIPVKRLRYKDGRDMALRGDDFIGVFIDANGGLYLLKGESKSRLILGQTTIDEARGVLDRDNGRCTPISLLFVADRMMESNDAEIKRIGKMLRAEVGTKSLRADQITHAMITFSGNAPVDLLRSDVRSADGTRPQFAVNIHIEDHQDFITQTFKDASDLGKY